MSYFCKVSKNKNIDHNLRVLSFSTLISSLVGEMYVGWRVRSS